MRTLDNNSEAGTIMAKVRGISKSQGYLNRVFCVEYDLDGMIKAYGSSFMHWLVDEIAAGRINCKQDVERWAAHVAIAQDYGFAKVSDTYGEQNASAMLDQLLDEVA